MFALFGAIVGGKKGQKSVMKEQIKALETVLETSCDENPRECAWMSQWKCGREDLVGN